VTIQITRRGEGKWGKKRIGMVFMETDFTDLRERVLGGILDRLKKTRGAVAGNRGPRLRCSGGGTNSQIWGLKELDHDDGVKVLGLGQGWSRTRNRLTSGLGKRGDRGALTCIKKLRNYRIYANLGMGRMLERNQTSCPPERERPT